MTTARLLLTSHATQTFSQICTCVAAVALLFVSRGLPVVFIVGMALKTSEAGFVVTIQQSGSDVVATGTGSIDLGGLTGPISFLNHPTPYGFVTPQNANLAILTGSGSVYSGLSGPTSFGTGTATLATSVLGSNFAIYGLNQYIELPRTYSSGSVLSSRATWAATTIAGLGLTPGTYTWNFGVGVDADFVSISVVPEPSTYAMALAGLACGGWQMWRRRRLRQAPTLAA